MKPIDNSKVKIKNLLGLIEKPSYEDLLFEIATFLESEQKDVFAINESALKTRCRINVEYVDDLKKLEEDGYLQRLKYTQYKLIKHLWEC
jgi:hypothetical protein